MCSLLTDDRYDDQQILDYLRRELWGYPKLLEEFHRNVKPALALAHDQNEKDSETLEQTGEGVSKRSSDPPNPPARDGNHEERCNVSVSSLIIPGQPKPNTRSGSLESNQSYAQADDKHFPNDEHPPPILTPKAENTEALTPSLQPDILGIGEGINTHDPMEDISLSTSNPL